MNGGTVSIIMLCKSTHRHTFICVTYDITILLENLLPYYSKIKTFPIIAVQLSVNYMSQKLSPNNNNILIIICNMK